MSEAKFAPVPASETRLFTRRVVMPNMLNGNGIVFGGALVSIYDECAGMSALRLVKNKVATVSIENILFQRPFFNGETILVTSQVIYSGRTSLVVRVDADVEMLGVYQGHAGSAIFNFVGLDENNRPTEIPQLLPETEEEKKLWAEVEAKKKQQKK